MTRASGVSYGMDVTTQSMPASTSIETMTTGRRPASISEEDNPTPPSRPPEPGSDSLDEQPAPAPPAPVAAQPTTPRPATTPNGGAGPVGNTDGLAMQERERAIAIARYQAAIDGNRAQIAANLNDCRQVCAASDGICRAAEMICRLTGDNVLGIANARDLRCRRARESCVSAGRERDGACPVCPTPQR